MLKKNKEGNETIMYRLNNIFFQYEKREVLKEINFSIGPGDILGIIGPNGSGKTTLLKILGGLLKPSIGMIWFKEKNLSDYSPQRLARSVAMVPQEHHLVFPYTVKEIVLMGRYPFLGGWAFESEKDYGIAQEAMKRMQVDGFENRLFFELSGGEKQRVIIARALAQQPEVLLLDEPATFLDLYHQLGILTILGELQTQKKITIILVSHDLNMASQFCQRLLLLNKGKIALIGDPSEVLTVNKIREVYECETLVDSHPISGKPRVTPLHKVALNE